jgi:hypothetical protein
MRLSLPKIKTLNKEVASELDKFINGEK